MGMDPNNNYTDWFERWGEADPEKDWILTKVHWSIFDTLKERNIKI